MLNPRLGSSAPATTLAARGWYTSGAASVLVGARIESVKSGPFGAEMTSKQIPAEPGVYVFWDVHDQMLYVGKATRLRERLGTYRRAWESAQRWLKSAELGRMRRRRRRRSKAERIVMAAKRVSWEVFPTLLAAELEETRLIQEKRPMLNRMGAYTHAYPFVIVRHRVAHGNRREQLELILSARSEPEGEREANTQEQVHGVFRSRLLCGELFDALEGLMRLRAQPAWRQSARRSGWRRLSIAGTGLSGWFDELGDFFGGTSARFLGSLALELLEKPLARARSSQVQTWLESAQMFYDQEARRLREVIQQCGYPHYPVAQRDRDPLYLLARHGAHWGSQPSQPSCSRARGRATTKTSAPTTKPALALSQAARRTS